MKIRLNLKPGQRGTRKMVKKYGRDLVCVRYRYDEKRKKRLKTVELIVEEVDWEPPLGENKAYSLMVGLQVGPGEKNMQSELRNSGGKWNREKRLWEIDHNSAVILGLEDRIVEIEEV